MRADIEELIAIPAGLGLVVVFGIAIATLQRPVAQQETAFYRMPQLAWSKDCAGLDVGAGTTCARVGGYLVARGGDTSAYRVSDGSSPSLVVRFDERSPTWFMPTSETEAFFMALFEGTVKTAEEKARDDTATFVLTTAAAN